MIILRGVATCAAQHPLTKDSELPVSKRFGNHLLCYPSFALLIFAGITLAMLSGCGGSSGSPAVVQPVTPSTPSISPSTGTYTGTQQVTISDTSAGAAIYYTTNGMTPTASSSTYTGPISITATSTVEAIAVLGGTSSAVATAVLTISVANPPVKLAFVKQPSNALASAAISPAAQVAVEDTNGNTVTSATNAVTIALTSGTGLAGTLTVTPQNGIASFSNLSVSSAGSYTLTATSSGLTSATSTSFTISAPVKLAFTVQPSNALTAATISPAVQVAVEDANGHTVTAADGPVTVALVAGTGLGGTLTVTPEDGIATFSNLTVSTGGSFMLSATSPGLTSATSASFTITVAPVTYYISPNGNDSNSGLSASLPWLTPDHPLNCGDMISAASGTYSAANFNTGKWGAVTCPAGNNVAWLQCATFNTCKIASINLDGMWVDQSYWGVQGWEITTNTNIYAACFHAGPGASAPATISHVIFANNVANGCMGGGYEVYDVSATASADYIAYVGNVAYNSAQGNGACFSGFNIYEPIATDTAAGTHMFVAGNYAYSNLDPDPCDGTAPTDGEGIILDTFDFSQGGGTPYAQQTVVENNIVVNNGGRGIEVLNNSAGTSHAAIYITQNTSWGNLTDPNQVSTGCGEIALITASNTQVYGNLIATKSATGCGANPIYPLSVIIGDGTDSVDSNFAYGLNNNNVYLSNSGTFAYGSKNVFDISPAFANATVPGAPSCQGTSNVPACMASFIADFAPTAAAAKGFGYQTPSATPAADPLFPQWLCTAKLPAGLVTSGCTQ